MADLDNLFNSPPRPPPRRSIPPDSPPTPVAGPSRSSPSANPLFLSPGSATDTPRRPTAAQRASFPVVDLNDAPADVDADDPINFDWDFDYTRAAARPAATSRGLGTTQRDRDVDIARPNGDFEDALDPFAAVRNGDEDGEGAPKKRRVMAKVDADRLTGDDGILKLMKAAKKFKVKGKGREAEDLKDLLNVYQMWAHGMFPKGDFMGTMQRVEVVCRTRRMESAMKGYRDAFYPRPRTPTPPPRQSLSPPADDPPRARTKSPTHSREPSPDATAMFGTKEPLFSDGGDADMDEEDGPDLDELRAMEEMEAAMASGDGDAQAGPAESSRGGGAKAAAPPEEEDEWEGLYD